MSSYTETDITDDEDSHQKDFSSEVSDSIEETHSSDSEDAYDIEADSKESNIIGTVKQINNKSSKKQENNSVLSDSECTRELSVSTINRERTSRRKSSLGKESTNSPPEISRNTPKVSTTRAKLNELSFARSKPQALTSDTSDSEEDIGIKSKNKRNVIESDSESDQEGASVLNESSKAHQASCSIEVIGSGAEVEDVTTLLTNSRISSELDFGKKGIIANSTLLDTESLDSPKVRSKRLFNRSADTPRILKQLKESVTPTNTIRNNGEQELDPLKTPRNVKAIIPSRSPSPSASVELLSDDNDIIDVSSDDSSDDNHAPPHSIKKIVKQTTLDSVVTRKDPRTRNTFRESDTDVGTIEVSPKEMAAQQEKVRNIQADLLKANNLLRTVNLENLPDKGKLIKDKQATIEAALLKEVEKMSRMVVAKEDTPALNNEVKNAVPSWDEIQAKASAVMPRTFGKQAMSTYNAQKAVTMERLQQLHGSLKSCPKEDAFESDPAGLKVELMPHQRRALAWLMWRENQNPSGGILADDMGLGKTLTMISLMLKTMEVEDETDESDEENQPTRSSQKFKGGTLVVCPASLLNQWSGELENRTRRGLASYELYHGPKRETKAKRLAEYDMVITTYAIVMNECEKSGAVFRVRWRRIIIDEAHQIRNHKSQTSEAVCRLSAKSRWALTGTPVHNKELDMYALLKFLRCTPFDDLLVWRRWVTDKSVGGQERLHTVISSLMLRRTKAELMEKGSLQCMPDRKWELIPVQLDKNEMDVYQKILLFSKKLFAQFLHQRAERNQYDYDLNYADFARRPNAQNQEYFKMRDKLLRFHNVKEIKQHEILVLLLRLRQICCHPSLITSMLPEDMEDVAEDADPDETNLLDQLNKLDLNEDHDSSFSAEGLADQAEALGLKEATKSLLNPSNPVFSKERLSSKIKTVLAVLKEKVMKSEDKAIIVSQWPSFLKLIGYHLRSKCIPFDQLDGSIPVNKRMIMVNKFNDPNDKMKILLLSLTAGGVGLNLIGANHLFLLDLHWNPQLENQAQDRIYRVGQRKPVFVYKFMATDTIEKRILDLQEQKLNIANSMLTGTKQMITSKLSLQDLKLLFEM